MKHDANMPNDSEYLTSTQDSCPSADFIHAISEFFDTDPSDLLVELGYYQRETTDLNSRSLTDMTAQQE